ncbi:MAG: NADH-quinone oxidoreductase subunit L [Candidatus Omnitrophica bacterium]|nr:NADH-quinone oxidoreductase subunit L [Candidatus Omnitrophota bacterium]
MQNHVPFLLYSLMLFPLAIAVLSLINRWPGLFKKFIYPAVIVLIAGSLALLAIPLKGTPIFVAADFSWVEQAMLVIEVLLAVYLLWLALKRKDLIVTALLVVQTSILLFFHFGAGHHAHAEANLFLDLFSVIMALIIGVIGSLIAMYAVGYMEDFHEHHAEVKDRRPLFLGLIFIFLSAMFGVCFSNNLMWLLFFWEITTVCSFLLIGYKGDEQSITNSFLALRWNLLGGLAFLLGIVILFKNCHTIELNQMMTLSKSLVMLPVALLCFAGITKSAQLPCSSWLVGAMVAPTPVSALLHSSTMVKAGVYLVLRFAGQLGGTTLGLFVAMIGLATFLIGSFICISQNDGKKILAYSTIANLGLIILCAGVGTYEAVWAGILLIIFHAIAKGLLFLCVGAIEHQTGSRQVEDMTGLIVRLPKIAVMLQIGIAGMFLAPFGMLISKWAVLRAIVDFSPFMAVFLIFGSAATLFFWVKWIGKILIVDRVYEKIETRLPSGQMIAMGTLSVLTVLICGCFAVVAHYMIDPYVAAIYGNVTVLSQGNVVVMGIMLLMVCLFPVTFLDYGSGVKMADPYLGGANVGTGNQYRGALAVKDMEMKNYYLDDYFNEGRLMTLGVMLGVIFSLGLIVWGGM